jgi:hypothetical protein
MDQHQRPSSGQGFGVSKVSNSHDTLAFSGSSPPEIFVGRWNYPNVYTGILAPQQLGNTEYMSSPEHWHAKNLQIPDVLDARNELIYARTQRNVKSLGGSRLLSASKVQNLTKKPWGIKTGKQIVKGDELKRVLDDCTEGAALPRSEPYAQKALKKFLNVMQEIAMTHKSVATSISLKKPVTKNPEKESRAPLISNAAPAKAIKLEENPKVKPKVDYMINDTDVKSTTSLKELHKTGINNETLIKLLSAGLLGLRKNRKLVPTRWSITAVDDTLSKQHLPKIKTLPTIQHYQVHTAEYLGNHYEFLLMPDIWSFEVMEISLKGQGGGSVAANTDSLDACATASEERCGATTNRQHKVAMNASKSSATQTSATKERFGVWHDHESHYKRKTYADSVTGAYYANRLAVTEYLLRKQKQAACLVFREIRPEYYAPLGVGILRQTSRAAFAKKPRIFHTMQDALDDIQTRLRLPVERFTQSSILLRQQKIQTKLWQFA